MSASLSPPRARRFARLRRDDARRDVPRRVGWLATEAAAIAWVPMLVLAVAERFAKGRPEAMALFASDFTSHVRFLIAIPLLIVADALTAAAISRCEAHLEMSGLVASGEPSLRAGIDISRRLRTSRLVSLAIAVVVAGLVVGRHGDLMVSRVYLESRHEGASWASLWHGFVAFPIFRFLLLRWVFRWLVWAGFLFWLRRLDLRLVATHPDRSGGLGFLTTPVSAALGVVLGVSATAAMAWRNAIVSNAAAFGQVRGQALFFGAVWLVLLLGPLVFFAPRLLRLRRIALVEYSRLGDDYTHAFHEKWIRRPHPPEEVLGTPDLQSLADLGGSMDVVHGLRPTPIDLHLVLPVVGVYAVALLPVFLSQFSLEELLARLVKVVL